MLKVPNCKLRLLSPRGLSGVTSSWILFTAVAEESTFYITKDAELIHKMRAAQDLKGDDIFWHPHRGKIQNDYVTCHSLAITLQTHDSGPNRCHSVSYNIDHSEQSTSLSTVKRVPIALRCIRPHRTPISFCGPCQITILTVVFSILCHCFVVGIFSSLRDIPVL
jgi:hypothetical protein